MNKLKNRNIYIILSLCIIVAIIVFFAYKFGMLKHIMNIRHIKRFILSYGKFSAVIFLIIYTVKPIVFLFPASVLSILAGNIFGSSMAFFLSMGGCFLAANFAFFIARILGKPYVDKILKGKGLKLDESIEKHGFMIIMLMRLAFIFPYDPVSYAAGLTKMKYKKFILGSMLGVAPEMLAYAYLGKSMEKPFSRNFCIPIIVIAVIAFTAYYFYSRYITSKNK